MALGGALPGPGPGCLIFLAPGLGCGLQRKTSAPLEQAMGQSSPGAADSREDLHPSQSRPHARSTGAGNGHQEEGWDVVGALLYPLVFPVLVFFALSSPVCG
mgnify:FL=1